jgi:rod shape-determining protein MreB
MTRSLRIAGDELTSAVHHILRDEYNMLIGERTAEDIKMTIGNVFPQKSKSKMTVRGRNILTGLPHEIELNSDSLRAPLAKQLRPIIDSIKNLLEEAPPEILSDIMQKGIYVSGGGALIAGIDELLAKETKIKIIVPENALTAVVEGAAMALRDPHTYRDVLMVSE